MEGNENNSEVLKYKQNWMEHGLQQKGKMSMGAVPYADTHSFFGSDMDLLVSSNSSNVTVPPLGPNTTEVPIHFPPCQWILYSEINQSRVRIWDLIILVPNTIFLLFLLIRCRTAIAKLQRTSSPIFLAFYGLVFFVALISVMRCVVAMTVNAAVEAGDITDKVLWLVLRFFLLATEMSVVVFGIAFGHLDSRTSIRRVLLVTFTVALIYSCTQGVMEFLYPDNRFHIKNGDREYDIFGHGGMLFWFISSVILVVIYLIICILPFTRLRDRFALPTKQSFYWYCMFLALLNTTQAVGSCLLYYQIQEGMCIVDVTTYITFTLFAPLVYCTFLSAFFRTSQSPHILFSYKAQTDEDDDTVNLPHQSKPETDIMTTSYDSTHFEADSPNPLYSNDFHLGMSPELSIDTDYYLSHTPDDKEMMAVA